MQALFELQKQLLSQFHNQPFYFRQRFSKLTLDNFATGIVGGRGAGKTTFLLHIVDQHINRDQQALYVSADSIYFLESTLLGLVEQLHKETDIRLLCVDEIHKYANWAQELKNITDTYQDFRILFSGSSMIDIVSAKYDLSRRVTLHHLNGFSFREYLEYTEECTLPTIELKDLLNKHTKIANAVSIDGIIKKFKKYCRIGYYPFTKQLSQETEIKQAFENIIQKVIYEDIATLKSLKTPTLMIIEKLFKYVVNSLPGELNVNKLSSLISKSFDHTVEYLTILQTSGLIRSSAPIKFGKSLFKHPTKLYPDNTNFIFTYMLPHFTSDILGKERETFFLNQTQNAGLIVNTHPTCDFQIDETVFEIGGRSKTAEQIKHEKNGFIVSDGILVGHGQQIPLYLFGFLY
ncbi:MAG: AAA family ATPase [Coxiellaceae bacterium]|nr:AAA family ATPase [Coxiellaceae bacterium]